MAGALAPQPISDEPPEDDGALVARARVEPDAFGLLYDRYADRVFRFCYRRLGQREAAEDATSVIFARALAGLPELRQKSFAACLFAIAHNTVVSTYRDSRPAMPLEVVRQVIDTAPSPEERAVASEAQRYLQSLLESLPADQRRVVELRLAGLTGAEIAVAMERSVASVKMLQARALARLRAASGRSPDG